MRTLARTLAALLVALVAVAAGVALSVPADAWLTRGAVARRTNAAAPGPAGPVRLHLALPAAAAPAGGAPAVVLLHEFWGLTDEIAGLADELAAEGYVVAAPDTMRGRATGWFPRALWLSLSTPTERVNEDLDAVLGWLAARPDVDAGRVAVVGFCYGGGKALAYSLHAPERVAATGVFYGDLVLDPARLARLRGPLLGVFGADDRLVPPGDVAAFAAALERAGVRHELRTFDGVGHAFVGGPERVREGGPPARAWALLLAFLRRSLDDPAAPGA